MAKKVYAVKKGLRTGIFNTWEECKKQVHGFPGAQYKSFLTLQEAEAYLGGGSSFGTQPEQDEDACIAYVDGSFDAGKQAYSYGCILLYQGERKEMSDAFFGTEDVSMRNVAGELEGAMAAMSYCEQHGIRVLHLYYDYQGIESWATGEWKRNKPGTIRYKAFYDTLENVKVYFHKVKGHSGVELNEAVDKLAKAALGIQ
nr:ribonuclease H family protein [uncultured Blautia sp.]